MEITVRHEITFNPEIVAMLQGLFSGKAVSETPAPAKVKREVKPVAEPIAEAVQAVEPDKEEVKEPVKAVATDVTVEQLRAVVSEKASAGTPEESKKMRAVLKNLLSTFGAENVTSLGKDKYAEFLNRVKAL